MKKYKIFRTQPIVLAIASALGFASSANALVQPEVTAADTVWSYTQNLNSVDGYRAFIATHADEKLLTQEARSRAISLLGDFDVGVSPGAFAVVPSSVTGESQTFGVRTAQNITGPAFDAPFGRRQLTFVEVFVDDQGLLIDESGAFVSPQGEVQDGAPYRVTSGGQLLDPQGSSVAEDVGIVPFSARQPQRVDDARIGRLSVRRSDFPDLAQGLDADTEERADRQRRARVNSTIANAQVQGERNGALQSTRSNGNYGG